MANTMKIRQRSEIPVEDTWAVEDLYASDEAWEAELKTLEEIGFAARYSDAEELPFHTDGAVEFPLQASFHPLKVT